MKDIKITITTKRQHTEIRLLGVCIVLAFLLNITSIIAFNTEWKELYTQLLWVISLGFGIYFLVLFLRLVYGLIRFIFSKKSK